MASDSKETLHQPPSLPAAPDGAAIEAPSSLAAKERVRIMRDGVLNNLSLLASGVIGIALVPIMLKGLGSDSYGIWIAALSIAGTASLFDFGLGMCTTREVARSFTPSQMTRQDDSSSHPEPCFSSSGLSAARSSRHLACR